MGSMADSTSIDPDALLRETGWLQKLAVGLVHDEQVAEDVVQSTLLTAISRPPRSSGALRTWLAQVARRIAYRASDRRRWREARERNAARPEAQPSAADLISRASVHRTLVEAVLDLGEPYRTVVLLRYFEGAPPRDIAKRQGVAVATVRTRMRRALEQLRQRLDRTQGGREAWLSALGIPAVPIATAGAVTAGTGALLMATKAKVAVVASFLLVGAFIDWQAMRSDRKPAHANARSTTAATSALEPTRQAGDSLSAGMTLVAPRRAVDEELADSSPAPTVRGLVVDDETGAPVGNAEVSIARGIAQPASAETRTGTDGSFSIPWNPAVASLLRVISPDHAPHSQWCQTQQHGSSAADLGTIRLKRGAVVSGRVVTANDRRPVAGASLFLRQTTFAGDPVFEHSRPAGTSGPDGAFTLPCRVAPTGNRGTSILLAVHPKGVDWVILRVETGQERVSDLEILTRDGIDVPLRVVDQAQRPLEDATVFAMPRFEPLGFLMPPHLDIPEYPSLELGVVELGNRFLQTTDREGSVRFRTLPANRSDPRLERTAGDISIYDFFALKTGFEPGRVRLTSLEPEAGPTTIMLAPVRTRTIVGSVRDQVGSPIGNASVGIIGKSAVTTNATGEYRITDVPEVRMGQFGNEIWLEANATGRGCARHMVNLADATTEIRVDFTLLRAATISGRVIADDGSPVQGRVDLIRHEGGRIWVLASDDGDKLLSDGSFLFSRADAEEWRLEVVLSPEWERPEPRTARGGENVEITVRKAAVGRARVVIDIVDAERGKSVEARRAWLEEGPSHELSRLPVVTQAGRVSVDKVSPGSWRIVLIAPPFGRRTHDFTVSPSDEDVRMRVELGRPGVVVARVVLSGAAAERTLERIPVHAQAQGGPLEVGNTASSGNDWTCRFETVAPGIPIRLFAAVVGDLYGEAITTVAPGEEKRIEIRVGVAGTAVFRTSDTIGGRIVALVADAAGAWHEIAAVRQTRPARLELKLPRPPGTFRWRVEAWPLDLSPRLRVPIVSEGEATIEAGKETRIAVEFSR